MKFLYFTDTHIRNLNPVNRMDDYRQAIYDKFVEIGRIIQSEQVDYILHGGDFFDKADPSITIASDYFSVIQSYNKPFYMIAGNHDVYGNNPETIHRTLLGLMGEIGFIKLLTPGELILLQKDDVTVQLSGKPYCYDMDKDAKNYLVNKSQGVDFAVHMVHGMLLKKPFVENVDYTLIDDIIETEADITLCGHYHSGFGKIEKNNKYFINPGSIARLTNTQSEIERIPQVVLMEFSKSHFDITFMPLKCAAPGESVLDRSKKENEQYQKEIFDEFRENILNTIHVDSADIHILLERIAFSEHMSEAVKQEALSRITKVMMERAGV